MNTVRLTTCQNAFNAQLLKGRLESEGIQCILSNETMSGYNMMDGVDIFIDDEDLEKARELIKEE